MAICLYFIGEAGLKLTSEPSQTTGNQSSVRILQSTFLVENAGSSKPMYFPPKSQFQPIYDEILSVRHVLAWLDSCLLTSWEVQFPSLLYVLLLKFSELDSYLSRGLLLVDVCRICDRSESQSCQVPTSGVCEGCLAPILPHSCGAKWSWIFGPWSQNRLRKGLWVL